MFEWLKKRQRNEILKLLFQNRSFLEPHLLLYPDDYDAKDWSKDLHAIGQDFVKFGEIKKEQIDTLLKINKTARMFYDQNDPEIKLYKAGYLTKKPKSFDQRYQPILGWKEYYKNY